MVIVGLGFWGSHEANSLYKNHIGTCTQVNEKTVELSGKIDVYMNDCAATMLTQNVTDIIVDSPGGDVVHGRKIGYKIGERDRTLHIDNYCGSSCGNYFIPAASKLSLSENAVIMLHGTPDPFTILREYRHIERDAFMDEVYNNIEVTIIDEHKTTSIWRGDPSKYPSEKEFALRSAMERLPFEIEKEERFAQKFDVPLGWRLYRDENSAMDGWLNHFEYEEFQTSSVGLIWVEKEMIKSCLPNIELVESSNKRNRSFIGNFLLKNGHTKSQDLKCIKSK